MSLPDSTTVLIVGAGPAGLGTALSLLHHGFHDFIIVDALPRGENISRAIVIHAATLEALDTIGCGDEIIRQGTKSTGASIRTRSTELLSPDIESLKSYTRHPYVLLITQNVTERVLEKKLESLNGVVYRPLRVVGMRRNITDPQFIDITFEGGRIMRTKYVVGADGARSVIRTTAGIGFSDPTHGDGGADNNLARVVVADVTFDTADAEQSASSGTLSPDNFFISFPLPRSFNESLAADGQGCISDKVYRIGCSVSPEAGEIPLSPSKEYLQDLIDRFGPYCLSSDPMVNPNSRPTRVKDILWSSHFRDHAAVADVTFTRLDPGGESRQGQGQGGVVLLVGDAAHVHSPVGGQGMSLGLRDAVFLGGALAEHIRATETRPTSDADEILRSFARVRRARALEVIGLTLRFQSIFGMKYRERIFCWCPISSETVRTWALWALGYVPFARRKIAWELSGLGRR